jgi:dipeptidyl aminopeptidase/acylaminoacyl peptidase
MLSPDERHIVVVTTRGLLRQDKVESSLAVFDVAAVKSLLKSPPPAKLAPPRVLARLAAFPSAPSSGSYSGTITNVRWSADSEQIFFLGEGPCGERQLYRVALRGGPMRKLTHDGLDVHQFDVRGDTILYLARRLAKADATRKDAPSDLKHDAMYVTGRSLEDILFPDETSAPAALELWTIRNRTSRRIIDRTSHALPDDVYQDVLSLSPNGKFAVRLLPVKTILPAWAQYEPAPGLGLEDRKIRSNEGTLLSDRNEARLREYNLVDLETGHATPLIDAPHGITLGYLDVNYGVWSSNGRRIMVTNTFLPIAGSEPGLRRRSCAAAVVDLPSLAVRCIVYNRSKPLRLQKAVFGTSDREVILQFWYGTSTQVTEMYDDDGTAWKRIRSIVDDGSLRSEPITVTVKQGLNDPPVLWARENRSGAAKVLWNPNPQLEHIRYWEASIYHWKDTTGFDLSGILVKPVDYMSGKKYPLLIQTHGFVDQQFVTDGQFPTAMAARAMASEGLMVLQVDHRQDHALTAQEASDAVSGFRGAVAQMSSQGLIDSSRVGVIGFSRTCWYVETVLTEDPLLFAAATIADGVDQSYMQYLLFSEVRPGFGKEFEKTNGGKPFGKDLSKWTEGTPGFHMDRVKTPLRVEAIGPLSVLLEWQAYASLRQQQKPVDMIYYPSGQHILQSPQQRYASEQGNVDWFKFWLLGREDTDEITKRQDYDRWEALRASRVAP